MATQHIVSPHSREKGPVWTEHSSPAVPPSRELSLPGITPHHSSNDKHRNIGQSDSLSGRDMQVVYIKQTDRTVKRPASRTNSSNQKDDEEECSRSFVHDVHEHMEAAEERMVCRCSGTQGCHKCNRNLHNKQHNMGSPNYILNSSQSPRGLEQAVQQSKPARPGAGGTGKKQNQIKIIHLPQVAQIAQPVQLPQLDQLF
eukprot:g73019.t1